MRATVGKMLIRYGWDTRCRNLIPAQALRPLLSDSAGSSGQKMLLDVGCGPMGLAAFLPDVPVVGVDVDQVVEHAANFTFRPGSITELPFEDRSFPFVSCVDVLEHLPVEIRPRSVSELVRVAERAVVIAFPHGPNAQRCDNDFRETLVSRKREVPPWLDEHLAQRYPTVEELCDEVRRAADATGRDVKIDVQYCESQMISRVIRATSARSFLLYSAVNLLLGAALPFLRAPRAGNSYRAILLAKLTPRDKVRASA